MTFRTKCFGSIAAIAALLILFPVSAFSDKECKFWTDEYNTFYNDYKEAPEDFIVGNGTIVGEFEADTGLINFFQSTECKVEVGLPDGKTTTGVVMRDKSDDIGDTIEVAFKQKESNESGAEGYEYTDFTRTKQVRLYGIEKTFDLLRAADLIAIAAVAAFLLIAILRKRGNRRMGEISADNI